MQSTTFRTLFSTTCLFVIFLLLGLNTSAQVFNKHKAAPDQLSNDEYEGTLWSLCAGGNSSIGLRFLPPDSLMSFATDKGGVVLNYYNGKVLHEWNFEGNDPVYVANGNSTHMLRALDYRPFEGANFLRYRLVRYPYANPHMRDTVLYTTASRFQNNYAGKLEDIVFVPGSETVLLTRITTIGNPIDAAYSSGVLTFVDLEDPDKTQPSLNCGGYERAHFSNDGNVCLVRGIEKYQSGSLTVETRYHHAIYNTSRDSLRLTNRVPAFANAILAADSHSMLTFTDSGFATQFIYNKQTNNWQRGLDYILEPGGTLTKHGSHYTRINAASTALEMIDLQTGLVTAECPGDYPENVSGIRYSPDQELLFVLTENAQLFAYEVCDAFRTVTTIIDRETVVRNKIAESIQYRDNQIHVFISSESEYKFKLYNLAGVLLKFMSGLNLTQRLQISTAGLAPGTYFVQLESSAGVEHHSVIVTD